ncbi:DoxX family protein [Aquitalea pelogenes]|uniref:DoxX family protein n=1 Tax=Aquitalea pelogenes TaxID=1293573 RepID=UPI0007889DF5|nr:DoxX family protein [Aquitalea pelogenes]
MQVLRQKLLPLQQLFDQASHAARPLVLLLFRLWVANVFFKSGLTKLEDWDTTLLLFSNDYHVPLLPPALAAVMGTFGETVFSSLLVVGLFGRFAAAGLFVVNLMAVISYPDLTDVTRQFHYYWAMLLLALFAFGPGCLSLDAAWQRWHQRRKGH